MDPDTLVLFGPIWERNGSDTTPSKFVSRSLRIDLFNKRDMKRAMAMYCLGMGHMYMIVILGSGPHAWIPLYILCAIAPHS
ncbi:hypothetical protein BD310DRAFT_338423 [Dichomitus squalens]|uniref:Uncharacterized protein n=1 Tax=Dichomitus squalens TaxID=114155 RepID=A0A4Q9Q021_9APHY|nr:hypothetical protein BD310DRAFT_338423 [Dichomitus squalens]